MANIRKSFNFRNGVQVDDDNFIVNANGLVGIGTSIPTEFLDVHGTAKVTGLVTATNLAITGVSTFYSDLKVGSAITFNSSTGIVSATAFYGSAVGLTDIFAIAVDGWYVNAGNISTTSKVGIATDFPNYSLQVGLDPLTGNGLSVDALTGNVNTTGVITATRFDGIGDSITDLNASAIASGTLDNNRLPQDISVSGIISAYSFTGFGTDLQGLNAINITNGILDNSRLPQDISISGIITAGTGFIASLTNTNLNNTGIATLGIVNASGLLVSGVTTSTGGFVGNITGTATTATSISGTPNITVANINTVGIITSSNINNTGIITSSSIISQSSSIGISTVSTRLYAESIGVGTDFPSSDIHIRRSSTSTLQVTSDTAEAIIAVGRSTTLTGSNGALIFGNTSGLYSYSNERTLDIVNYDIGGMNYYLNYSGDVGNIGDFNWVYAPNPTNPLMTLTYGGNLGIGITNPTDKLEVDGNVSVSSLIVDQDITATGAATSTSVRRLYILEGQSGLLDADGNQIISVGEGDNLNITSGISTFFNINVSNNAFIQQKVGIGNTLPLEPLHIGGDYILDPEDAVVLNSSGIGIGTTSIRFGLGVDAAEVDAIFGTVGIGTTNVDNPEGTRLYVNGPSVLNGNTKISGIVSATSFIGNGSGLTGISTFSGDYNDLTNRPINLSNFNNDVGFLTSSDPLEITVESGRLVFNVVGVGSTSFLLA